MTGDTTRFAGAVIVAAGRGERFGNGGKVMAQAAGQPLLAWSLDAVMQAASIAELVVVCGVHTQVAVERLVESYADRMPVRMCIGGETRQDSVRAGIELLSDDIAVVVIHDAARPLATPDMFDAVTASARQHGAAITAIPVTDTIKEVDGERIVRTIPRELLWAAQTPQAYRVSDLRRVMDDADVVQRQFTDEAALMEHLGRAVRVCAGASSNLKVTVPEDLVLADVLLRHRRGGDSHVSS